MNRRQVIIGIGSSGMMRPLRAVAQTVTYYGGYRPIAAQSKAP